MNNYYDMLIASYEDELGGFDYFEALLALFESPDQIEKLNALTALENQTSDALSALIEKYQLTLQSREHIRSKAIAEAKQAEDQTWQQVMAIFAREFPPYVEQFKETLALAPAEDKAILQQTVDHEIALIAFVQNELDGLVDSLAPVKAHIEKYRA